MMDPKANIQEQREIAVAILDGSHTYDDVAHMATRLAELVTDLDEWRKRGGFDPYLHQTS